MSQSMGLGYDPKYEGFDPQYPMPPRVHWLTLLAAWIIFITVITLFVPDKYNDLLQSLVFNGWVFYLCHWIRTVNPEAKSPFWCDVYVIVQLSWAGLGSFSHLPVFLLVIQFLLTFASLILGIATIFMVRSDLEDHYNNREHAGLVLSGVMTFFFNFFYFQYHLFDIAKRKQQAQSLTAGQLS